METKICRICHVEKEINKFQKNGKYYRTECKECHYKMVEKWKENNIKHVKEYNKKYRFEHKEYYKQYDKIYGKIYYNKNKDKIDKKNKIYIQEHKEEKRQKDKEYYEKNKIKIKNRTKCYSKKRNQEDKIYKLKGQIRCCLGESFRRKKYRKNSKTEKIIGCELEIFINYLLNTFKNNYGVEWDGIEKVHIDHIIPLANANTEEEVMQLCRYSNLQLLKAKDNLQKNSKLDFKLKGE